MKAYRRLTLKFLSLSTGMTLITVVLCLWSMDVTKDIQRQGTDALSTGQSIIMVVLPIMIGILMVTAVGVNFKLVEWYYADMDGLEQEETDD